MTDNRFSLLLVDDEPDFLDATKRWMEHKGHTVATAAGGAEALELQYHQVGASRVVALQR